MTEEFRQRQTLIPSKTPTQSALPRMTGDHASNSGRHDQTLQGNCTGFDAQGLIEESEDGYTGDVTEEAVKILHAEEHGNGVKPGSHESNRYSAHDGNGNHLLRTMNFFSKMRGAIEASECPIGINQAYDEG